MYRRLAGIIILFVMSGCSHEVVPPVPEAMNNIPPYQSVRVDTPGMCGAQCTLSSGRATYTLTAPQNIIVEKSAFPMTVTCTKGDHFLGTAVVDPVLAYKTAEREEYSYPATVSVPMQLNRSLLRIEDLTVF